MFEKWCSILFEFVRCSINGVRPITTCTGQCIVRAGMYHSRLWFVIHYTTLKTFFSRKAFFTFWLHSWNEFWPFFIITQSKSYKLKRNGHDGQIICANNTTNPNGHSQENCRLLFTMKRRILRDFSWKIFIFFSVW